MGRSLCPSTPEISNSVWWMLSGEGWLRLDDPFLAGRLDRIAMRLDAAFICEWLMVSAQVRSGDVRRAGPRPYRLVPAARS